MLDLFNTLLQLLFPLTGRQIAEVVLAIATEASDIILKRNRTISLMLEFGE
jgi:hypothetical protein